jgi:uncharacterized membrane protein affecting hemolysin expression
MLLIITISIFILILVTNRQHPGRRLRKQVTEVLSMAAEDGVEYKKKK